MKWGISKAIVIIIVFLLLGAGCDSGYILIPASTDGTSAMFVLDKKTGHLWWVTAGKFFYMGNVETLKAHPYPSSARFGGWWEWEEVRTPK